MTASSDFGIYIHVPFCEKKCPYCDFYSATNNIADTKGYVSALIKEISMRAESFAGREALSIYLGGGTPSLLDPAQIRELLNACRDNFKVSSTAEITMEMNPESVSAGRVEQILSAGINRISLGIQSFDDRQLKFLGRIHNCARAVSAFAEIRNTGCRNISCDLIYSMPEQSKENFRDDLNQMIALAPESVSCYELTIEKGTKFYADLQAGLIDRKNEENEKYFFLAENVLGSEDYEHYEISNYAKKGFRSVHNLGYWQYRDYFGAGPSAVTLCNGVRHKNIANVSAYTESILAGASVVVEKEILSAATKSFEKLMLGLRLKEGVLFDAEDINESIQKAIDEKLLIYNAGMLRTAKQSWPVLDNLLLRL